MATLRGGGGGIGIGDYSGWSHAKVVAQHANAGVTADRAHTEKKQLWKLGSRISSAFYATFNPLHEASKRSQGIHAPFHEHRHEGVHALDWVGFTS